MTVEDYLDWWSVIGICPRLTGMSIGGDRAYYDCCRAELSEAGFVTLVVHDFAGHFSPQHGAVDVTLWQLQNTLFPDAQARIDNTATALEAISAGRLAKALRPGEPIRQPTFWRTLWSGVRGLLRRGKPRQTPGVETLPELEQLLADYVAAHQADLESDLQRHGDPRKEPGFNRWRARRARRERELRLTLLQMHEEELPEMTERLSQLEALLGEQTPKNESKRKKLAEWVKIFYDKASADDPDLRSEAMNQWLRRCRALMDQHADHFPPPEPPVTELEGADDQTKARLATIGPYTVDRDHGRLVWKEPPPLACDFMKFDLVFHCDCEKGPDERTFEVWERYRQRHAECAEDFKRAIIEQYRGISFYLPSDLENYPPDLKDEEILELVRRATIGVAGNAGTYGQLIVTFDVEWDEEHLTGFLLDGEGNILGPLD